MDRAVNKTQRSVLLWIQRGCLPDSQPTPTFKVSALALQDRRLVVVDRRRGHPWTATITNVGRYFLKHHNYPHPHHQMGSNPQPPGRSVIRDPRARPAKTEGKLSSMKELTREGKPTPTGRKNRTSKNRAVSTWDQIVAARRT